ncbi:hypothetical protein [Nocardioides sp. SYSU D00065]|uniref:hypothetical protein n=1 Tax=Nocardioides sp. SYSU D00065 TaxID=2817378 RepID=UPI001B33439D|nr:hypothetical protein [Nocardioides sp. SYSU D00065]
MTDHRPPACHYDRDLGERVTTEHRDDCPDPTGHRGCKTCTAPHCTVCGRAHATNEHPVTCPACQGRVDQDLAEIADAYDALAVEAVDGGGDGRLVAAAPIPGGVAQILRGPTVSFPAMRTFRGWKADDHERDHPTSSRTGRPADPVPPLAILALWEDAYRAWLGHSPAATATVAGAVAYLRAQLPYLAQRTDGPDWHDFTRQVRDVRAQLEHALHDGRDPERGVECFECGETLVRRWRRATPCTHPTPARRELQRWARLGYPEALTVGDVRAAYQPCGDCDQGGIENPTAGQSWECPGCRKEYDPGEYATAVRRDLLTNGAAGDGWTHISMAAEAASTMTGGLVLPATVRKWMDRNKVASCCLWEPGRTWGVRLVFWPDVADAAVDLNRRVVAAELQRKRRSQEYAAWTDAVEAGEDPKAAGERLGIARARVRSFLDQHDLASA